MSQGKFSRPRPYREEDRQIEQAYRQVTGQAPVPKPSLPEDLESLPLYSEPEAPFSPPAEETLPVSVPPFADSQIPSPGTDWSPEAPEAASPQEFSENAFELPLDEDFWEADGDEEVWEEESGSFWDSMPEFLSRAADFFGENKKIALAGLCVAALVLIISIISVFFASTSDPYEHKILNNVYVAGVNLGGMTKSEAVTAVRQAADLRFSQEDMVLNLAGTELRLSPSETSVKLNVKSAVNAAYDYGRKGTNAEKEQAYLNSLNSTYTVPLSPYLDFNQRKVRERLEAYASDIGNTLTQTNYGLEGKQPALSADQFDETAPGQTLVIVMGTPGLKFDVGDVLDQILEAYGRYEFSAVIEGVEPAALPDPLDLKRVYDEFYIAPVDASIDPETRETTPASYGYGFDLEAAQALVNQAAYGEEIRIPMEYIEPEILEDDMLFTDILGQYQTAATRNEERNINLSLACQMLDGVILDPGETFSFNETVGQRTTGKGYRYAPIDKDSKETAVGGGVTQVSSTLYYSALLAGLDVRTHKSHDFPVSYIDYGLDADTSWDGPDLRFTNNTDSPIQIEAELSGGYVSIRLLGRDPRTHYIRLESRIQNTYVPDTEYQYFAFDNEQGYKDGDVIQEGRSGYQVSVFQLKYDRQSNSLISRDEISSIRYQTVHEILARVEPEPTTQPTTQPTTPPTTPTTVPATAPTTPTAAPTTQPTETTAPESTQPVTQPSESTEASGPASEESGVSSEDLDPAA